MSKGRTIIKNKKVTSEWLFFGILLFFMFEYIRPGNHIPILNYLKIGTILPLSIFIFSLFSEGGISNNQILRTKTAVWYLFFLALIIMSGINADVTYYVFMRFIDVFGYLISFFFIIKIVDSDKRILGVFKVLVLLHLVILALNPNVLLEPEKRNYLVAAPFLGDGNDFALSLCCVWPFSMYLFQKQKSKLMRIILINIVIILIFSLIATQSRGGFIAIVAQFFTLFALNKKKKGIFLAASIVILSVVIYAPTAFYERIKTIGDYQTEGSAQGRLMAWNSAIRMALDNPLTGVGAGHFAVKYGTDYRPYGVGRTDIPWVTAHSLYFLALGELGFFGMIIIIGIITTNIYYHFKRIKILNAIDHSENKDNLKLNIVMITSLIGFAVGSAFLSTLYYPHLYFLSAISNCVNTIQCQRRRQHASKSLG